MFPCTDSSVITSYERIASCAGTHFGGNSTTRCYAECSMPWPIRQKRTGNSHMVSHTQHNNRADSVQEWFSAGLLTPGTGVYASYHYSQSWCQYCCGDLFLMDFSYVYMPCVGCGTVLHFIMLLCYTVLLRQITLTNIVLHYHTALHCAKLGYFIPYNNVPQFATFRHTTLLHTVLHNTLHWSTLVYCITLHFTIVCCITPQ